MIKTVSASQPEVENMNIMKSTTRRKKTRPSLGSDGLEVGTNPIISEATFGSMLLLFMPLVSEYFFFSFCLVDRGMA